MVVAQLHRDVGFSQRRVPTTCFAIEGKRTPFGGTWVFARNPLARLKGLSARTPDETVLVFPRCNDVHTFTMRYPLDIAFVDGEGEVIEVRRLVLPGMRLSNQRAQMVIERFSRAGQWFVRGDGVFLACDDKGYGDCDAVAKGRRKRRKRGKL